MRKILSLFSFFLITSFLLTSCGSSTETAKNNSGNKSNKKVRTKKIIENFVITPYRTKIKVKPNTKNDGTSYLNIWYGYGDNTTNDTTNIAVKSSGFRVQILSTDNLEQAKRMKNRVLQKISQKHVHILFDPPFYKLQVGDFFVRSLAEDLSFKLKQLGYDNARVVREKINHYR